MDADQPTSQQLNQAALTVAAAGGHNVLMIGPPGSGKTVHKGLFPAQRGYRAAS